MEIGEIKSEVEAISRWLNENKCPYTAVIVECDRVRVVTDDESAPIIFGKVVCDHDGI